MRFFDHQNPLKHNKLLEITLDFFNYLSFSFNNLKIFFEQGIILNILYIIIFAEDSFDKVRF